MALSKEAKLKLFQSLFRGRTDVFARRWEKYDGSVSGYAPVYTDWKKKDSYEPLTQKQVIRHLAGQITLGIYPLLNDNTSHFIVVDFDGKTWLDDARKLIKMCTKHNISVYLERSRSGNGGHVWGFFEDAYPAYKSRKVFFVLLREAKIINEFDKSDSFDRLFPNQDHLSGKGIGNLIALPLQSESRKAGNTVFLDPDNEFDPYADQGQFLTQIQRLPTSTLDNLFAQFSDIKTTKKPKTKSSKFSCTIDSMLVFPKGTIPSALINLMRDELNFLNTDYTIKEKMGFATYKLEKYFKTIVTDDSSVYIPRGFLSHMQEYIKEHGIACNIDDQRTKLDPVQFTPSFDLFEYQQEALEKLLEQESGVLVAPPGAGKTILGLSLIAKRQQPALIITHRKQIYDQWIDSIQNFLGVPKKDIGQYTSIKKQVAPLITVATVQTLVRCDDWDKLKNAFGTIVLDECHHVPARMFRDVVNKFNPYYLYGLTATPKRKNNDEKLIYAYLGPIIHEIPSDYQNNNDNFELQSNQLEIKVRDTELSLPFKPKSTDFKTITKILCFDTRRNEQIITDVTTEAKAHNKCLILTERKEHAEILHYYLKRDFETILFTGDLTPKHRLQKEKQIKKGDFQILIATGQILGEGSNILNLDCLFLVFPFAFEGKLIQYIGRIQRGEKQTKKVYDYRDSKIAMLEKLFKQRKRYYNKILP